VLIPPPPERVIEETKNTFREPWYRFFRELSAPQSETASLYKSVSFDTDGIGSAASVAVGSLPAGCLHYQTLVRIRTTFNGGTNQITVGTTADGDHYCAAADVDPTVADLTILDRNIGEVYTADTPVYVRYEQTGSTATQGAADVVLLYAKGI
jgi:hypothetical protein